MSQQNPSESLSYIRPASVPGTELLIANNSTKLFRVFHETYTLCSCAQTASSWRYGGKEYFTGDRGNMLMEPGEMHCNTAVNKPSDYKVVFISPTILQTRQESSGYPRHLTCAVPGTRTPNFFRRFTASASQWKRGKAFSSNSPYSPHVCAFCWNIPSGALRHRVV